MALRVFARSRSGVRSGRRRVRVSYGVAAVDEGKQSQDSAFPGSRVAVPRALTSPVS